VVIIRAWFLLRLLSLRNVRSTIAIETGMNLLVRCARGLSVLVAALALLALSAPPAHAQQNKGGPAVRDVQGIVTDAEGKPQAGAIVQLKNTKTLQIISFITKEQGDYYFHDLSTDIDFQLSAERGDKTSAVRTLSSFDTRRQSVLNLKLDHNKK
jgi:hypothetical protein